jgi:23S rRNA (adenine-N6)-dimethyltransferase
VPARSIRSAAAKTAGYHRIRDAATADRIIASTGLAPPDLVVEFGAGDGQLTAAIAARARKVLAVELDRERWRALKQRFEGQRVTAVLADFMAFQPPSHTPYKLVSNVPFGVTSRLLRRLASLHHPPRAAYLILQVEAAQRWAGTGHETAASVFLKARFEVTPLLALHRSSFAPRPNVDAMLVSLVLRHRPLVAPRDMAHFEEFIRRGFGGSARARLPARASLAAELGAEQWAARCREGFRG